MESIESRTWDTAWGEIALARRFVEHLRQVPADQLRPAVPPVLDRDPYLSAWTNVQAALANAPPVDRARLQAVAEELDREVDALSLSPVMAEAARRAIRGLLAQRWLITPESFGFVFEPFESVVPLSSLQT